MNSGRITNEEFACQAVEVHGDKYDYSKTDYKSSYEKVEIVCRAHGPFKMFIWPHLQGKGCRKCASEASKTTNEEFISKSASKYGQGRFDYSKTTYTTNRTPVEITCPKHGSFKILPNNHLGGNGGCRSCSRVIQPTTEEYIQKAIATHENLYDYSKTRYVSMRGKIIITCPKHGDFQSKAGEHIRRGHGCKLCVYAANSSNTKEFINRALEKHGNLYDYSKVEYVYSAEKVEIICSKHGIFKQRPAMHVRGAGCPKCSNRVSKKETSWLNSLNVNLEHRQKTLRMPSGKLYSVDAYVPETNTVYEFNGDFWHGNPAKYKPNDLNKKSKITFGALYEQTRSKEKELTENGYNVVSVWESEVAKKL
jgi:G:T-mismatch repair DNA endonuclease (very short patch repair protein)